MTSSWDQPTTEATISWGQRLLIPRFLRATEWAQAMRWRDLLSRARALDLSVGFVDSFYDIDVADDLTRLAAELRLAPARAPRTAQWLKEWELLAVKLPTGTGEL